MPPDNDGSATDDQPDASSEPEIQPSDFNSQQAADLARAKIAAFHSPPPSPGHTLHPETPAPAPEEIQQNPPAGFPPTRPHPVLRHRTLPRYQRPGHTQTFGTYSLPTEDVPPPHPSPVSPPAPEPKPATPKAKAMATIAELKTKLGDKIKQQPKELPSKLKPFVSSAIIVAIIFIFYNHQIVLGKIEYFISPGEQISTPAIIDGDLNVPVSPESKIIIPKINVDVPVVYDETSYDEKRIQAALQRGVVHYGTTPVPGTSGNNVIVGHSSNSFWTSGKYKFAFVLLDKLENGDTFLLHYDSKRFIYEVYEKRVVEPTDFSVLEATAEPTVTLITCVPPGTSWNRLIIKARQISPDPVVSAEVQPSAIPDNVAGPIPGNTPSLWDKVRDWLF